MPSVSALYTFSTAVSAQGFVFGTGTTVTGSWASGVGNPAGSLNMIRALKSNTNDLGTWTLTGTFATAFGIPTTATVTGISAASLDWRCATFTSANRSSGGPSVISFGGTGVTLSNLISFAASGASFTTTTGAGSVGLSWPATGTFTITISGRLANANTTGSTVSLYQDNLGFSVNYVVALTCDSLGVVDNSGSQTSHSLGAAEFLGFLQYSKPFDVLASQRRDGIGNIEFRSAALATTADTIAQIEFTSAAAAAVGLTGNALLQLEYSSSRTRDMLLPLSEVKGILADAFILNEFPSAKLSDYVIPIEEVSKRQTDSIDQVSILSGTRIDGNNPISLLSVKSIDTLARLEFLALQNKDHIIPIEELISNKLDSLLPTEWVRSSQVDYPIPIELLSNKSIDNNIGQEFLISLNLDTLPRIENTDKLLNDILASSEWIGSILVSIDNLAQVEFLANRRADSNIYSEFVFSTVKADFNIPIEYLLGSKNDSLLRLAWLSRTNKDNLAPFELSALILADTNLYSEFVSSILKSDSSLPIESLFGSKSDVTLISEWLFSLARDSLTLSEWLGSTIRVSDSILPIELRGNLLTDTANPFEFLAANRRTDYIIPSEFLTGQLNDTLGRLETFFSNYRDYNNPIESRAQFFTDTRALLETVAINMRSDSLVLTEALPSLLRDGVGAFETLFRSQRDFYSPIDWTSSVGVSFADNLLQSEFQHSVFVDGLVRTEFVLQFMVTLQDALLQLEWSSLLAQHAVIPNETQLRLINDILARQSWNISVTSDKLVSLENLVRGGIDSLLQSEYLGQSLLIQDAFILSEFQSRIIGDINFRKSWNASIISDKLVPLENLARNAIDSFPQLEYLGRALLIQDAFIPNEFQSRLINDASFRQSWVGAILSDKLVTQENLFSNKTDTLLLTEYISQTKASTGNSILQLEFIPTVRRDSTVWIETSISIALDTNGLLEFFGVPLITLLSSFGRLSSPKGKVRRVSSPGKERLSTVLGKIRISISNGKIRISIPIGKTRIN